MGDNEDWSKFMLEEEEDPSLPSDTSISGEINIPWIGYGYGVFLYDKVLGKVYRTAVRWKNTVNIFIKRENGKYSMKTSGKLIFSVMPRPSPESPEKPDWFIALTNTPKLSESFSSKCDIGYVIIPGAKFIRVPPDIPHFDGKLVRLVVEDIYELLRENRPHVLEIPYEIDYNEILNIASKSSEIRQLFETVGEIEKRSPLSLNVTYRDPMEILTARGFASMLRSIFEGEIKKIDPSRMHKNLEKILDRVDEVLKYGLLFLGVKNDSVGTFLQSDIFIKSIGIIFPDCKLSYGDVYVLSENVKHNIIYEEGRVEIYDIELKLGQEARIPLAINSELLNKIAGKPIKVKIKSILRNPWDIVTGGIERSAESKIMFGLIYYTPMGYPITISEDKPFLPEKVSQSKLPASHTVYLLDIEDEIKFEVLLKVPYKYEFFVKEIDAMELYEHIIDVFKSMGFSAIVTIEPTSSILPKELGLEGLLYAMIVFSGNIEGIRTTIRAEILSRVISGSRVVEGSTPQTKIRRATSINIIENRVIIRAYISPTIADSLSDFLQSIYENLKSRLGERL